MYMQQAQYPAAHYASSQQQSYTAATSTTSSGKFVPAFALDDTYSGFSAMTHTVAHDGGMGLKAASFVSMEHTAQEHEYQPTCQCTDCQGLLHDFTQYDILDSYLTQHLPYEKSVEDSYGFVPCIGGPQGNVGTRFEQDPVTGDVVPIRETSTALFFHFHRHWMKDVAPDIKVKSYLRFVHGENAPHVPRSSHNGNGQQQQRRQSHQQHNNNQQQQQHDASYYYQQQQPQQHMAAKAVTSNYHYNHTAAAASSSISPAAQQQYQTAAPMTPTNNHHQQRRPQQQRQQQQQQDDHWGMNYVPQNPYYCTQSEIRQAAAAAAYTTAAQLGQC